MRALISILVSLVALAAILGFALGAGSFDAETGEDAGASSTALSATSAPMAAGEQGLSWQEQAIWDDGLAEFAAYEVTWPRYGHLYTGRALLILVKEPWAPDLEVKADRPRPESFEVLKLNHVRDVATGIYTYHQMASLFWRRDGDLQGGGALRKIKATSSEACGISTARVVGGKVRTGSYFDGQGQQTMPYPTGVLAQDGLPATLRGYLAGDTPGTVEVFPSLLQGRFPPLRSAAWTVRRMDVPSIEVPAGTFRGLEIRLDRDEEYLSYTFDAAPPHVLLRFAGSDGTEYRLAKVERLPYWQMAGPGQEEWLPEAVRY